MDEFEKDVSGHIEKGEPIKGLTKMLSPVRTVRQTDKLTDRQTDRQTYIQTYIQTDSKTDRQKRQRVTDRHRQRQTAGTLTDRQTLLT